MKKLKLIHTADWHLSEKINLQEKARNSLDQMVDFVGQNNVNGILISGDIWDRIQPFGNNSAIKMAYEYLSEFSKKVDFIFIIKGNSSHDACQSIELLHQFKENIYAYENNISIGFNLQNGLTVIDPVESINSNEVDFLIHGISYPVKAQLLSGESIDLQNDNFIKRFEEYMEYLGTISSRNPQAHKITMFHGNVAGSKLSTGQSLIGQDIIIPSFVLEKNRSDYYALGHIHLPQNITDKMRYSGSLYNKDFGETEQKYFDFLEFDNTGLKVTNIPLTQCRPMAIVEADFIDGTFVYNNEVAKNAEIKFRFRVKENERGLITASLIDEVKKKLGEHIKLEMNLIAAERVSRTSKIMEAVSLIDEVEEYAKVTGENMTSSLKEKINQLEIVINQGYDLCEY